MSLAKNSVGHVHSLIRHLCAPIYLWCKVKTWIGSLFGANVPMCTVCLRVERQNLSQRVALVVKRFRATKISVRQVDWSGTEDLLLAWLLSRFHELASFIIQLKCRFPSPLIQYWIVISKFVSGILLNIKIRWNCMQSRTVSQHRRWHGIIRS